MRRYYLRQRSENGNWYAIIMNLTTKKPDFSRCTGTNDEKQANSIAQDWMVNEPPDICRVSRNVSEKRNMPFCEYLRSQWQFETSEYIKEKITEGKEPKKSHPLEMIGSREYVREWRDIQETERNGGAGIRDNKKYNGVPAVYAEGDRESEHRMGISASSV